MKVFEDKLHVIGQLCRENKVRSLFAFGSAARNELTPESDIDLLVDFEAQDPIEYTNNYFNLLEQLQKELNRPIDLLETRGLKNRYLKAEIDRTKIPLYE